MTNTIKHNHSQHELRCDNCKRLIGYIYAKYNGRNNYKCIDCYMKEVAELLTKVNRYV